MGLTIHTQGVSLDDSIRQLIFDKVERSLSRISGQVNRIEMHLIDVNGPHRSGPDKLCRLIVQIAKQKTIVLEDQDSSVGAMVDRITDRLWEAVDRQVDRLRSRRETLARRPMFGSSTFPKGLLPSEGA